MSVMPCKTDSERPTPTPAQLLDTVHSGPAKSGIAGMTTHARKRAQQRCISQALIDFVLRYGSVKYDKQHGERYFFDKRSRKRLRTYLGPWFYAAVETRLCVFVVVVDGMIVTCGWQTKPIRKN